MPNSAAESSRFREALQKPPFAFGRVIGDSFTGVGRTWFSVLRMGLVLSLITAVLPFALAYALGMDPIEIGYDGEPTPIEFVFAALFILGSVVTLVFHAACLDISYRALIGHDTDLRGSLRRGLRYSAPLLVIAVLFTVGYTIGLIALVIPGVILAVGWAVAGPAYIFEGVGVVESLKRSWQLTRGYKWMVFFVQPLVSFILQIILYLVAIVGVIVLALIGLAVGEVTAAHELLMTVGIIAVFMLAFLIYKAFFASMTCAIYAECVALQNVWAERLARPLDRPDWLEDGSTPPPA